jgi:hypothetical protein
MTLASIAPWADVGVPAHEVARLLADTAAAAEAYARRVRAEALEAAAGHAEAAASDEEAHVGDVSDGRARHLRHSYAATALRNVAQAIRKRAAEIRGGR